MDKSLKFYYHDGILYKRVRKDYALRALEKDHTLKFFLVGNRVHPCHFHAGEYKLATSPHTNEEILSQNWTIQLFYNNIMDRELGDALAYYIEVK